MSRCPHTRVDCLDRVKNQRDGPSGRAVPSWPIAERTSIGSTQPDITKIMGVVVDVRRYRRSGCGQADGRISRSRSGLAAASSHWTASSNSVAVRRPVPSRSRSTSSTAHANTYSSSCSASSSSRATTSSWSLSSSSRARCRATQSHWRHRWAQNSRGRPGPRLGGSARRHHRQCPSVTDPPPVPATSYFVMTES